MSQTKIPHQINHRLDIYVQSLIEDKVILKTFLK